MKNILFIVTIFLLIGCGYKPTVYYAKNSITGQVYVNVPIDIDNGESSVLIKDSINEMVLNRFNATLTNQKELADTIINAKLASVSHSALSSDNLGYVKLYRTTVSISLDYQKKGAKKILLDVSNYYDYNVEGDASLNDQTKQESTRIAVNKAIDDIFSKIAVNTFKE